MTIVYDKLRALDIPEVVQTYTEKDAILYALGLGLGHDPLDADELPFVYEKSIKLLPTFAVVLGWPGFWARDLDRKSTRLNSSHITISYAGLCLTKQINISQG